MTEQTKVAEGTPGVCHDCALTCGGVGVEEGRPTGGVGLRLPPTPDMISSVMSLPPWLGSRIRILEDNDVERDRANH